MTEGLGISSIAPLFQSGDIINEKTLETAPLADATGTIFSPELGSISARSFNLLGLTVPEKSVTKIFYV